MNEEYYYNLINKVSNGDTNYSKLFHFLYVTPFEWPESIPLDANRSADGLALRESFAVATNQSIADILPGLPCTVLEMMVALAERCERDIMHEYEKGNRTGEWFWIMLQNSGLASLNDIWFDEDKARQMVLRFEMRKYNRDGSGGGLFVTCDPRWDMRIADIWYQMNWYITDRLRGEGYF